MIKLFLDIETLPGPESLKEAIWAETKPPATLRKPESIQKWELEEKPGKVEEEFQKTSLKGHRGRILCIGYVKEGPKETTEGVLSGDEAALLTEFWDIAEDVGLFVGFNVLDFDLKFIMQRSIIQRVKPSRAISFARYRSEPVYDVMTEWVQWSNTYIKLDELALALGLESPKGTIDGSKVYDYYLDGKIQEICDYCLRDVHATRDIYQRMTFQD